MKLASSSETNLIKRMKFKIHLLILLGLSFPLLSLSAEPLEGLRGKLLDCIGKYNAQVGIAVIYNSSDTLTIHNQTHYPLMSVFKFHQALAVGNHLQERGLSYDSVITISKDELKPNTYSPLRDRFPEGNIPLSIAGLLTYTLQLSDNNACDILFDRILDVPNTNRYIRTLVPDGFSIEVNEDSMHLDLENCYRNWTTPLAAACLMDQFVNQEILSGEYHDFIYRTMIGCNTGEARLPYPLQGSQAIVGHKTGTGDRNAEGKLIGLNDLGFIILPDGRKYVIAVFVKDSGESYETTEKIIAEVSSVVYEYLKP